MPWIGALAVDQVALVVEPLAGGAVEAAVGALLDVAGVAQPLDEALHEGLVLGIGGADEEVVGRVDAATSSRNLGASSSTSCAA